MDLIIHHDESRRGGCKRAIYETLQFRQQHSLTTDKSNNVVETTSFQGLPGILSHWETLRFRQQHSLTPDESNDVVGTMNFHGLTGIVSHSQMSKTTLN